MPSYEIWLDGILLDTVDDLTTWSAELPHYEDEPPALEIVEVGDDAESSLYPPRVMLQWRGNQEADGYRVEQLVGAAWETRVNVAESGRGYYPWRSDPIDDGATATFRVSPIDEAGNVGTPLTPTSIVIARNPAPPSVSFAVTAGNVVVSAA